MKTELDEILNCLKNCFIIISEHIRNNNNNNKKIYDIKKENKSGDNVKFLDLLTNNIIKDKLSKLETVRYIVSEEEENMIKLNKTGKYMVSYDPLDGSSNIDVNITVGTIFGIYRVREDGYIKSGRDIVFSGYCLYGGSTELVYASKYIENGLQMEILINKHNKCIWEISRKNYIMPTKGNIYSINESNKYKWYNKSWENLINEFIKNKYTTRWIGSLVADAHRTLIKGGFFAYPINKSNPTGRIRLLYESYPMAYVFEKAQGIGSNGEKLILDLECPSEDNLHIKTQIILSGKNEFDMYNKQKK
jgi:fructose-1,6-bisphosphatase I